MWEQHLQWLGRKKGTGMKPTRNGIQEVQINMGQIPESRR